MAKPFDEAYFAFDPFVVVRAGARPTGVEELMVAALNIDGDGELVVDGVFNKPGPDLPSGVFVKVGKLELLFFLEELFE